MNKLGSALFAGLAVAASPLGAHHGGAIFDPAKTVTVVGAVTDFAFINPHVLVYITVMSEEGREVTWGGELTSPNRLARMGGEVRWHKDILRPGDVVTMTGHPARNGAPAMDITRLVDASGAVLVDE